MNPEQADEWMRHMQATLDEPLHPDLEPYLESGGPLGRMLRHPLVYQVPYHHPGLANSAYAMKTEALAKAREEHDLHSYVFLHERPWRLRAVMDLLIWAERGPEFSETVTTAWTDSENIWQNRDGWGTVLEFLADPTSGVQLQMDEDEQQIFDALPDTVTVFRGAHEGLNEDGLSWTLDREIARWFAVRLSDRQKGQHPPVLVTGTVAKDRVLAVLNGRSEHEVIPVPGTVRVLSVEPVVGPTERPTRST